MTTQTLDEIKAQRQKVYGDPFTNHRGIAMAWAALLQPYWQQIRDMEPLPPHQVALMMGSLKLLRMRMPDVFHADNYDDLAVYVNDFARTWQKQAAKEIL